MFLTPSCIINFWIIPIHRRRRRWQDSSLCPSALPCPTTTAVIQSSQQYSRWLKHTITWRNTKEKCIKFENRFCYYFISSKKVFFLSFLVSHSFSFQEIFAFILNNILFKVKIELFIQSLIRLYSLPIQSANVEMAAPADLIASISLSPTVSWWYSVLSDVLEVMVMTAKYLLIMCPR